MTLRKIGTYLNDRVSLIVGIGVIISIHWGWYRLQQVPHFVPEKDKKEFPLVIIAKQMKKKVMDSFSDSSPSSEASDEPQLTK